MVTREEFAAKASIPSPEVYNHFFDHRVVEHSMLSGDEQLGPSPFVVAYPIAPPG